MHEPPVLDAPGAGPRRFTERRDTPERVRDDLADFTGAATVVLQGTNSEDVAGVIMYTEILEAAATTVQAQEIETSGIGTFLREQILPPLLGIGAIVLLTKAMRSAWSGIVTIVALSMLGLMWFGFSANPDTAIGVGESLVRLVVPGV